MKILILSIAIISVFAGCSAKEINANVDSITGDISNLIEDGKDKSAE